MRKIVVAISGASGSVYAKILLEKLLLAKDQWGELSVVMTENAKQVWKTELDNESYKDYSVKFYSTMDFMAPFCFRFGAI